MLFKNFARSGILAGIMLLFLIGSDAQAASACKGLASSQCSAKSDCVWVGGYTRKDNRKVSGYCRAKGGKNATTGKTKTRKASSSKDSSSTSKKSPPGTKKKSSAKSDKGTEKKSAKQSSGKKSKKEKTTTKKGTKKSKSDSGKAKTKEKKKAKKTKTGN